jgi:hypothetical protein
MLATLKTLDNTKIIKSLRSAKSRQEMIDTVMGVIEKTFQ